MIKAGCISLAKDNNAERNSETLNTTNAASSSLAAENIFTSITIMYNSSPAKSTCVLKFEGEFVAPFVIPCYFIHQHTHTLIG